MRRILLLTGMTPDERIFSRLLPLLPTGEIVNWIVPDCNEPLVEYASRLGDTINSGNGTIVCGVSFGGIVARELAVHIGASHCVLIASVRSPAQLPPWFRIFRNSNLGFSGAALNGVGMIAGNWPRRLRPRAITRLKKLHGRKGQWHRWATSAVLTWKPSRYVNSVPLTHIHGSGDTTFPIRYTAADEVILGGGHVLPLTHPKQIADLLCRIADEATSP